MIKTRQNNDVTAHTSEVKPNLKLSCHDRSNWMWSMMKIRQDNEMIDHTIAVYAENEIELS